jgi:peptidoglycan glycosyltransferase
MNRPIRNLAIACMVLFLALLINATYLQYWQADDLTSLSKHPDNRRVLNAVFSEDRGAIVVRGKTVAESNKSTDQYDYQRVYPLGRQYAQLTGFFTRDWGLGGIESSQNNVLAGDDPRLFVNRVIDLLRNQSPQVASVSLTINPKAQQAAYDGLKALGDNVQGAVVALEPSTGKILAMVSSPTYDPNRLATHDFNSAAQGYKQLLANDLSPLNNRAIEERLPPGSTFKLVTAAAALQSGKFKEDSLVPGGSSLDLPLTSKNLINENGGSCGGGKITLKRALEVSCNVAFGSVGLKLGPALIREQAQKFGFESTPFHDLDDALTRQAASQFQDGDTPPDRPQTAFSAIGQSNVAATPLQMAMVAAAIANGGTLMKPYLVDEIRSADLEVIDKTDPQVLTRQAVSPSVAAKLTDMMVGVVDNGTAVNARIPGVAVAGKTGTAQSAKSRAPYAWFVSFAPAGNDPKVAVAVLVQDAGVDRNAISGNGLAAPIARAVMKAVLGL